MIRKLDLESKTRGARARRSLVQCTLTLLLIGVLGGLFIGTLDGDSARAAAVGSIRVDVSATPTEAPGSGGEVVYTYLVTNTSETEPITLTGLADDLLGQLDGAGDCVFPVVIDPNGTSSCRVTADLVDTAGSTITTMVFASALDADGEAISAMGSATVTATEHARLLIGHSGVARAVATELDVLASDADAGEADDLEVGGFEGDDLWDDEFEGDDLWNDDLEGDDLEGVAETGGADDELLGVVGTGLGYSDRLVDAPTPIECAGEAWLADRGVHMGDYSAAELEIDTSLTLAAGRWRVADLVVHDADIDRASYPQADERLRVEFWLDGHMIAASKSTPDLEDGPISAWFQGSLGTVELPHGADRVILSHSNVFDGTRGTNSFEPHSLCLSSVLDNAPPTEAPGDFDRPTPVDELGPDDEPDLDHPDTDVVVDYVVTVENVGDVAVTALSISSTLSVEYSCDGETAELVPGATLTCSGVHTPTPDELLLGIARSTVEVDTRQTLPRTSSTAVLLPTLW